ncbi:uncharacterized protein AAG666_026071 [Megaptera novaeangliae]
MGPGRIPCAQDEPAQVVNAGMSDPRRLLHGQSADRATVHPASGRWTDWMPQRDCGSERSTWGHLPLSCLAAATLTAGPLQARPAGFPAGSLVQLTRGGPGCSTLYGSLTSPRSASPQKRREPTGGGTPGRHLFCWSPVMAASEPPGAWGGH